MSAPSRQTLIACAVMAMEASLVYPWIASWLGGPGVRSFLGPAAALSPLALGYLAARYPRVLVLPGPRLGHGFALSLALRLLVTLPGDPPSSVGPLLFWLASSIVPALVGLAFWSRGGTLVEAELGAEGVRTEFTAAGGGLLVLLAFYGEALLPDPLARNTLVVCFLASGLAAVGLARQEAAGSPRSVNSGTLVAGSVLLVLCISLVLVVALRPEVASAFLSALGQSLLFLVNLLLLPLVWLFSWIQIQPPERMPQRPLLPRPPVEQLEQYAPPAWLQQLFSALALVFVLLVAILGIVLLLWLLSMLLNRTTLRDGLRAPAATEYEGGPWEDVHLLLAAFQRWLRELASRAPLALPVPASLRPVRDARAAYRALLRWAKARGLEREPPETPVEFQRRLTLRFPEGAEQYQLLTAAYEVARYGGTAVSGPLLARLRQSLEELARLTPSSR